VAETFGWNFDNSYGRLPDSFHARQSPAAVRSPQLVVFNTTLADELGVSCPDPRDDSVAATLAGNLVPDTADPLAQAYAGCQFGHFTMLGDGRALLLGEQITPSGQRFDIQFKGSGRTRFSRGGDGRAALGPMLREYIISEAMAALGVPTTRSLAVVATGEPVYRERALPGAVLTRVAASHIRVGTFEYFSARRDLAGLKQLANYTIARHYPHLAPPASSTSFASLATPESPASPPPPESPLDDPARYLAFLREVANRQADLIARWLGVGFVHGVMNTDNMAVSGETIDYGPCAFLDTYDPATVFSSIDSRGRYAFGNQPGIAQWNLARLAEALLPLLDSDTKRAVDLAMDVIQGFPAAFEARWTERLRAKLGWLGAEPNDLALAKEFLDLLARHSQDYTNAWRQLTETTSGADRSATDSSAADRSAANLGTAHLGAAATAAFEHPEFAEWLSRWHDRRTRGVQEDPERLQQANALMRSHNPRVIPRNHRVEEALAAAVDEGELEPLERLLAALQQPYDEVSEFNTYREPPPPTACAYRTFCGT
jgi:uncharacterized protein YdiU (UPF0061 family)